MFILVKHLEMFNFGIFLFQRDGWFTLSQSVKYLEKIAEFVEFDTELKKNKLVRLVGYWTAVIADHDLVSYICAYCPGSMLSSLLLFIFFHFIFFFKLEVVDLMQ